MCQAKSKGGVRCASCRARSLSGSKATMKTASILTGTESKEVSKVFTELRKEGANLPEPSQEDVMAYARSNKYMAKYGPEIPDNQRNKLVQKWEEAEKETPDGGTFHAWRNTTVRALQKFRRTFTALGISSAILLTSACGMGGDNNNTPSPSPSVSVSQSATPTPTTTTPPVVKDGITNGGVVSNGAEEYMQAGIADNDPALKLDDSKVTPAAKEAFSEADLQEANKVAVTYTATQFMDSTANSDSGDVNAWWAQNKDRFDPEYAAQIKNDLDTNPFSVLMRKPPQHANLYTYVYDKSTPRMTSRNITPESIDIVSGNGRTAVFIKNNVDWTMKIKMADGSIGTQVNKGSLQLSLLKEADGSWKIAGFNSNVTTGTTK